MDQHSLDMSGKIMMMFYMEQKSRVDSLRAQMDFSRLCFFCWCIVHAHVQVSTQCPITEYSLCLPLHIRKMSTITIRKLG